MFAPDPNDRDARYLLEMDSLVVGVFTWAEGLKATREVLEIDEGGRRFALQRIGPYAEGHFTLLAGASDLRYLFDWFLRSRDDSAFTSARRSGDVIYLDGTDTERMRWRFKKAQVTEWMGPSFPPAPGEAYGIERLGISHEGVEPIPPR